MMRDTLVKAKTARWSTRHGDAHNSDFYDGESPEGYKVKHQLLKNIPAATFVAVDEEKNMYVLTLVEETKGGSDLAKRLCSFDTEGKLRWTSSLMLTSLTSIGLAERKYLYTTDGAFLYKLKTQDGSLVWKRTLEEESSSIMFLSETEILVLGIKGNLYLFGSDGVEITPAYPLECKVLEDGVEHAYMPKAESQYELFRSALKTINVDKNYTKQAVDRFFGKGVAAKNVPTINQEERIIYLLTSDATGEKSLLIALKHDHLTNSYQRQFTTPLGPGCDSSPNLSFDCSRVYCTAGNGELYSVDAHTGEIYWTYQLDNSSSASLNSTTDKCIYISIKDEIVCIKDNNNSAKKLWQTELTAEAKMQGFASALVNSVLVISQNHVHGILGYCHKIGNTHIPFSHSLLTLDRLTGETVSHLNIEHESMCTPSFLDQDHLIVPSKPFYKGMKKVMQENGIELPKDGEENQDFYGLIIYGKKS